MAKPLSDPKSLAMESLNAVRSGNKELGFIGACHALVHPKAGHMEQLVFAEAVEGMRLRKYEPVIRDAILAYLRYTKVDHRKILSLWSSWLMVDPSLAVLAQYLGLRKFDKDDWSVLEEVFLSPFVTDSLKVLIFPSENYDVFFRKVRRSLLLDLWHSGVLKTKHLSFVCALAEQCFLNEYVYFADEEELNALRELPKDNPIAVSILACYVPLYSHDINPKLSGAAPFRSMIKVQVLEPLRERELEKEIERFSDIEDSVSMDVRSMYEENPYPRWKTVNLPHVTIPDIDGAILIAGCGTGPSTIQTSILAPKADVTAIDITRRSIAYAMRKSEEYGVENITFRQGDIMQLEKLDKKFDFIECSGVLHHMADPVAGWKKLIERMAPGGRMLVCLYSTKGRVAVKAARTYVAENGYKPVPDDIRRLRHEVFSNPSHPLGALCHSRDFYALSEMRDLIFHVQEITYTLPELKNIIDDIGLEFLRMKTNNRKVKEIYNKKFPEDADLKNLEHWDKVEDEYPSAFSDMYKLILKKRDDLVENRLANAIVDLAT